VGVIRRREEPAGDPTIDHGYHASGLVQPPIDDNAPMRREIHGLLVDPVDGPHPGVIRFEGRLISELEMVEDGQETRVILPGFVDLQIYDWEPSRAQGVTGYLATVGTSAPGVVDAFLGTLPDDPACLGAHVEGPYLNPAAAGAQAHEHIRPVDLAELGGWLSTGAVRMVTLAPELHGAFEAIERIRSAGAVAAIGHTATNHRTAMLAVDAGARFATHLWNAMSGLKARAPGAIGALLEDERVTLGLIADGRHLHPATEALTIRAAGPRRIALTSDLVPTPQHRPDGKLLGGSRCGAALVRRVAARFGLADAATMASLVPAELLSLADRGRLAPGFRADLAVLDANLAPIETIIAGETAWRAAG
jgi:N-acetylglucosamine-6-phosphate deacetylase